MKQYAIWFVDLSEVPAYLTNAKCRQLIDWVDKEKPFGDEFNVVIVPSKEDKVCILKTETEFLENFHGDSLDWIASVKNSLEDCLTINLDVKNNEKG